MRRPGLRSAGFLAAMGWCVSALALAPPPRFDVDPLEVAVAQMDGLALVCADARRQGDVDARSLDTILIRAGALEVRRMRHDSPRDVCEARQLSYEIVAHMVTDSPDGLPVRR